VRQNLSEMFTGFSEVEKLNVIQRVMDSCRRAARERAPGHSQRMAATALRLASPRAISTTQKPAFSYNGSRELLSIMSLTDSDDGMCEDLLAGGADVNFAHAEAGGRTPLVAALWHRSLRRVQWLLQHGADVNLSDDRNRTPFFHACTLANVPIMRHLAEAGAQLDAPTSDGTTPLRFAIEQSQSSNAFVDVVRVLLELGAELRRAWPPHANLLAVLLRRTPKEVVTLLKPHVLKILRDKLRDWMIAMAPLELPICNCLFLSLCRVSNVLIRYLLTVG
jgi:hypothetical protein